MKRTFVISNATLIIQEAMLLSDIVRAMNKLKAEAERNFEYADNAFLNSRLNKSVDDFIGSVINNITFPTPPEIIDLRDKNRKLSAELETLKAKVKDVNLPVPDGDPASYYEAVLTALNQFKLILEPQSE